MPNLSLVVCGAPLATRAHDLQSALRSDGWAVTVILTAAATGWFDSSASPAVFRHPDDARSPRPDAVVVCPMTFNTGNKWAAGVADTPALSLLCEALGAGHPIVAVPFLKDTLWAHPAWSGSLLRLQESGVRFVDPADGGSNPRPLASGAGAEIARSFRTSWVLDALRE